MIIEVVPNDNCEAIDSIAFSELEAPRILKMIKTSTPAGNVVLLAVAGWTVQNQPCPAYAVPVRDSGDGQAVLLFGGDGGIRFKPIDPPEPWDLKSPRQWGEAYRVVADESDLIFESGG